MTVSHTVLFDSATILGRGIQRRDFWECRGPLKESRWSKLVGVTDLNSVNSEAMIAAHLSKNIAARLGEAYFILLQETITKQAAVANNSALGSGTATVVTVSVATVP